MEDCIQIKLKTTWEFVVCIHLAREREQWLAVVLMVMNVQVIYNTEVAD
jgi:hypothetical protein